MSKICSVDGCKKKAVSKHLCSMHYKRKTRHGDVGPAETYTIGIMNNFLREYYSFYAMKTRCYYERHSQYKNYGGRGIKVCDRWLGKCGLKNFIEDMGPRPDRHSLDRIDPDGDYCPENCRWATAKEQANNKSSNKYLEFQGQKHTIAEWSELLDIPSYVLYNRLNLYKWPVARVFSTPYKKRK